MVSSIGNHRELATPSTAISSFRGGDLQRSYRVTYYPDTVCIFTYHFPCHHQLVWCSSAEVQVWESAGRWPLFTSAAAAAKQASGLFNTHPRRGYIAAPRMSTAWIYVCLMLGLQNNRHPAVQISRIPTLRRRVVLGRSASRCPPRNLRSLLRLRPPGLQPVHTVIRTFHRAATAKSRLEQ